MPFVWGTGFGSTHGPSSVLIIFDVTISFPIVEGQRYPCCIRSGYRAAASERAPLTERGEIVEVPYSPQCEKGRGTPMNAFDLLRPIEGPHVEPK